MIVITETSKVCTLLLGKYHTLQIEKVDFNFEMCWEIIMAFALEGTKMSTVDRGWVRLEKTIFSLFKILLLLFRRPLPQSSSLITSSSLIQLWQFFMIEPQSLFRLLTDFVSSRLLSYFTFLCQSLDQTSKTIFLVPHSSVHWFRLNSSSS